MKSPTEFEQFSFSLIRDVEAYIIEAIDHDPREVPEEWENTLLRLQMLVER